MNRLGFYEILGLLGNEVSPISVLFISKYYMQTLKDFVIFDTLKKPKELFLAYAL